MSLEPSHIFSQGLGGQGGPPCLLGDLGETRGSPGADLSPATLKEGWGTWSPEGGRAQECSPSPAQIRTLRLKILAEAAAEGIPVRGARNQLRMYLTMAVAAAQPLLMYWLTFHLVR